jgi:uncharacterized protein (TIGR02611 family)
MIQASRKIWRQLIDGKPGSRFQERYLRRRQTSRGRVQKGLAIVAGALLVVVGIILLPAPGPGVLIVLAGATLIAQESLAAARVLDRFEVRLRNAIRRR